MQLTQIICDRCGAKYVGDPFPRGWGHAYLSQNGRGHVQLELCPRCARTLSRVATTPPTPKSNSVLTTSAGTHGRILPALPPGGPRKKTS